MKGLGILLQTSLDVLDETAIVWLGHAAVNLDQTAVAPNQILIKIPFGGGSRLADQGCKHRIGVIAAHRSLDHHRKTNIEGVGAKVGNFLIAPEFLAAEVSGGKADNHETRFSVAVIQTF